MEVLQWACANGCSGTLVHALRQLKGGTSQCCRGRVPTDARGDSSTCIAAAEYGHLEVLQWARANGCPEDEDEDVY